MTRIWNPYVFTPLGNPIVGEAPPVLRVMGGMQATAQQLSYAQQRFTQFVMQARLSTVPNPAEAGRLPDGTQYRIVKVGPSTVMEIWPAEAAKDPGGGVVVFYAGTGFYRVYVVQGEWRAKRIVGAYCGTNVQRAPTGGAYFLDNFYPSAANAFLPTRLTGLVRDRQYWSLNGVVTKVNGYILECDPPGEFNFSVLGSAGGLTSLRVTGRNYDILVSPPTAPSDEPTKRTEVVNSGMAGAVGFYVPSAAYARRLRDGFVLVSFSEETVNVAAPNLLTQTASPVFSDLLDRRQKSVWLDLVESRPPYSIHGERFDSFSQVEKTSLVTDQTRTDARYKHAFVLETTTGEAPPDSFVYTYQGFPANCRAVTGVLFESETRHSFERASNNSSTKWLRECVDYEGHRYQISVSHNVARTVIDEGRSISPNEIRGTGQSVTNTVFGVVVPGDAIHPEQFPSSVDLWGSGWTLDGELDEFKFKQIDTLEQTEAVHAELLIGQSKIALIDLDFHVKLVRSRFERSPPLPWDYNQETELTATMVLRRLLGIEEKSMVSVLQEVEFAEFSATPPDENWLVTITAQRTVRLCVYKRGERLHSIAKSVSPYEANVQFNRIPGRGLPWQVIEPPAVLHGSEDYGAIATSYLIMDPGPYSEEAGVHVPKGIWKAGSMHITAPPTLFQRQGWDFSSTDPSDSTGGRWWEYDDLFNGVPLQEVRFALDAATGGCVVVSTDLNILISAAGGVTPLSQVTRVPDNQLDFWCASL